MLSKVPAMTIESVLNMFHGMIHSMIRGMINGILCGMMLYNLVC